MTEQFEPKQKLEEKQKIKERIITEALFLTSECEHCTKKSLPYEFFKCDSCMYYKQIKANNRIISGNKRHQVVID